jgi:carbamoyl-phosphate synthase small subunit
LTKEAILVLEDGSVYEGYSFGAETTAYGEVVFNTSMTGYQEMLTDPSYAGQIVVPTYPLLGNYGINPEDFESKRIQVRGFVVREHCPAPSHWQSTTTLHEFLAASGIPGIAGIDTRALTRRLRLSGVMMGLLTSELSPEEALEKLKGLPRYDFIDFVKEATTESLYQWQPLSPGNSPSHHIVAIDCGLKYNILRLLNRLGCTVSVVPSATSAEEVLKLKPDGIVLSPGPGDPALLGYMEATAKGLIGKKPIMGICLGHQILGRAFGGHTFKLKFGHRGGNHPVRDLLTGRVYITAQNHGYTVDAESLEGGLEVSHINLEASPGPQDNLYLFDRFLEMVREAS